MNALGGLMDRLRAFRQRGIKMPHALGIVLVVGVAVALAADALVPMTSTGPSASPGPSSGATAAASSASTPGPGDSWTSVDLPPEQVLADLAPVDHDTSGVSLASSFLLTSRTGVSGTDLAAGLAVEPSFAFTVKAGATPAEARIIPKGKLLEGTRYRFRLTDPTGALVGTWAYRTELPLHVVRRVPDDQTTQVPTDTGIEITFDQDGATDVPAHFSIAPAVTGKFQTVGRTVVFMPEHPLAEATIYRVTLSAGVPMEGSDQVLEAPTSWAFETVGPITHDAFDVGLGRPVMEASPREAPVIGVDILRDGDGTGGLPAVPLHVYRLPTIDAARAAAASLLTAPAWAHLGTDGLVATAGLKLVLDTKLQPEGLGLEMGSNPSVLRLPAPLAKGWYLVVVPREGRDRQALLQVTDLAAWSMTSQTRTLAWIHDLGSGAPIEGARLVDPAGHTVGSTNADGLIDIVTPTGLRPVSSSSYSADPTIATVVAPDGRRVLVALGTGSNSNTYDPERNDPGGVDTHDRWWLLLATDRTLYRTTDTVHTWGLIRARDSGSVPPRVTVRLRAQESSELDGPWLAVATAATTTRGVWVVDLGLRELPFGYYVIDVVADGGVVNSTGISIGEIRKPPYRIDVGTDHTAVIEGDPVTVTGRTVYFDGTAAPGLDLRLEAFSQTASATTDATGAVSHEFASRAESRTGYSLASIGIAPTNPEEGQISGGSTVAVFPSAAWIEATGVISGGRLVLTGGVSHVDLAAVEQQLLTEGWPSEPAGAAFPDRIVTVRVVELVPKKTQVGTTYDFIEKKVVPIYQWDQVEKPVGTYTTTSGPGGELGTSIAVPDPTHSYQLTIAARDAVGRVATLETYVSPEGGGGRFGQAPTRPYLDRPMSCGGWPTETVPVDANFDLTMYNGDGSVSSAGQYLFVVTARGVREAILQSSPTLVRRLTAADLPSLSVLAIRFGPGGYAVTNQVSVRPTPESRALTVTLGTDQSHYQPGDSVTVSVHVAGPDGAPAAADVVIRGVDQKLFAIGGAADVDALGELLRPVGDGLLQSATTHLLPQTPSYGGCGDTTGGREDFRDSVVFKRVSTDAAGNGAVTFPLPDDITSWHVSASAVDDQLRAGDGAVLVPVGLPFFTDAILASEYLVGEQPVLRLRSAGDALAAGDRVRYTVSAPSLLMAPTTVEADAFATAAVPLPALPLGVQAITIEAAVVGHADRHDKLIRKITVRASRLEVTSSTAVDPTVAASVGGPGLTRYLVTDAGRGSFLPAIWGLTSASGARFERALAAELARSMLVATYGVDPASLPPSTFDIARWERGGISPLPYASADLELSALTAIVAPGRVDAGQLAGIIDSTLNDPAVTRERRIIALAGRAGTGTDVLTELASIDRSALSVRETLWLGLAYLASGDETTARSIERDLLRRSGRQLGPWVRLEVGGTLSEIAEGTGLLAILSAGVGDPLAPRVLKYLEDNPDRTVLTALHEASAIQLLLERLPRTTAEFAWTVDGVRHDETIEPGSARTISVTAAQRAGLTIQPIKGEISVVASWVSTPGPGDLPSGNLVTISRTVLPPATASATGIVHVTLRLAFAPTAPTGCYEVTDRTPSGLSPITATAGWEMEVTPESRWAPWAIDGQRISWCVDPAIERNITLTYTARVVSPGDYSWEPAIVQSGAAPDLGASTASSPYTIR
jgi:hypothetical protein